MLRFRVAVAATPKQTCCRSTPRCANCPVLAARARSRSRRTASLFDEIYNPGPAALPDSVTDALIALALARRPRHSAARSALSPRTDDAAPT